MDASAGNDVVRLAAHQRAPKADEPVCVVCGRYGEYICDATDDDVCSLECRDICTQRHRPQSAPSATSDNPSLQRAAPSSDDEKEQEAIAEEARKRLDIHVDVVGGSATPMPPLCHSFASLPVELLNNITTSRTWESPTPVQMQMIPAVLMGNHVLVSAPTGTGKTAAFLIPLLVHILEIRWDVEGSVSLGLVLAPIRELAIQIEDEAKTLVKGIPKMKTALVVGGLPLPPQLHRLRQGVQLVVATPGRLIDILVHHDGESLDGILDHLRCCVVDEVDMMLSVGFRDAVTQILASLLTSSERVQLVFTSATVSQHVETMVASCLGSNPSYIRIRVGKDSTKGEEIALVMNTSVNHSTRWLDENGKKTELFRLLVGRGSLQTLVFVDSRIGADMLAQAIEKQLRFVRATSFHAGKSQHERLRILEEFVDEKCQVLVTTNVLGRGIDVLTVDLVVIFDAPKSVSEYVHLIGRVGRGMVVDETVRGASTMFVNGRDAALFPELVRLYRQHRLPIPEKVYSTLRATSSKHHARKANPAAIHEAKRAFRVLQEAGCDDLSNRASAWASWNYSSKRTRYT